jgi:hypothetical protein
MIRAMTRGIGPRILTNLVSAVENIHNLDRVASGQGFWITDIRTKSSAYFKRLDIPSEPYALRLETVVKELPLAGKSTPVFKVNVYSGPEHPDHAAAMKNAKYISRFVGADTMAANLAKDTRKRNPNNPGVITDPEKQDSKRYDRAFNQAKKLPKDVEENFADGKGPGRPGDSVRHGIPKKATMAELERASHAKGRKGQLARWQLNMRRGHKK